MNRSSSALFGAALFVTALFSTPAYATWSIVAVDAETGEVGSAGATCGPFVWFIAGIAPGEGAVVSQGRTSFAGRDLAVERLLSGDTPQSILDDLKQDDDQLADRQYAIVSLNGPSAAFTGDALDDVKGALSGETYSVQGNILADEELLPQVESAFLGSAGLPLGERLLIALEAGAALGGDARCDADKGAESAYLMVAAPGDDENDLRVSMKAKDALGEGSPIEELRTAWEEGDRQLGCQSLPAPVIGWSALFLSALAALRRRR